LYHEAVRKPSAGVHKGEPTCFDASGDRPMPADGPSPVSDGGRRMTTVHMISESMSTTTSVEMVDLRTRVLAPADSLYCRRTRT
jgi:hypothetical protein